MNKLTAILLFILTIFIAQCTNTDKKIFLKYKYLNIDSLTYTFDIKNYSKVYNADTLTMEYSKKSIVYLTIIVDSLIKDSITYLTEKENRTQYKINTEDSLKIDTTNSTSTHAYELFPGGEIKNYRSPDVENADVLAHMKGYYEQSLCVFPTEEISVGYRWNQNTIVDLSDETANASTTYHFTSIVREAGYDCALLEYRGNLVLPIKSNSGDSIQIEGIDKIESDGTIYFAYKEGIIIRQFDRWLYTSQRKYIQNNDTTIYNSTHDLSAKSILTGKKNKKLKK